MRFVDISSGLRIPISNEEHKLCKMIQSHSKPYPKSKLDIREREVARQLVHKGLIQRILIDGKTHFIYNQVEDWRG